MLSLQRIFGREADFYVRLIESTRLGIEALDLARELANGGPAEPCFERLRSIQERDKAAREAVRNYLVTTFITPIEREDISAISQAVSRLAKLARKFAERYSLAPERLRAYDFAPALAALMAGAELMERVLVAMQQGSGPEKVQRIAQDYAPLDENAHAALVELKRALYQRPIDPITAICLSDVLGLVDKLNERLRDALALINTVLVKNS